MEITAQPEYEKIATIVSVFKMSNDQTEKLASALQVAIHSNNVMDIATSLGDLYDVFLDAVNQRPRPHNVFCFTVMTINFWVRFVQRHSTDAEQVVQPHAILWQRKTKTTMLLDDFINEPIRIAKLIDDALDITIPMHPRWVIMNDGHLVKHINI